MQVAIDLLNVLLPVLYGLTAVNYAVYFVRRDAFSERLTTPLLLGTLFVHIVFLVIRFLYFMRFPIASMAEALTVIAAAIAGVYLYLERIQKNRATGIFIVVLVCLLQLLASAFLPHNVVKTAQSISSPLFGFHTIAAVFGYSSFAVGAVYGGMYLLLYRALKNKTFGLIFERLPSLDVLANMSFGASLLGWIFLTATIFMGAILSLQNFPGFYRDPQFVLACVVWVIYAASVAARFFMGWRGARLVYFALVGFCIAILGMFGTSVFVKTFHSFSS